MSDDLNRRPGQQPEDADGDYAFLQETIKGDQMDGRKFFRKGLRVICCGFLFGVAFILGAAVFAPTANIIRNSSSGSVSLFDDESVETSEMAKEDEAGKKEEKKEEEKETQAAKSDEEPEELMLNAENYTQLYRRIREVRRTAEASLADVRGYAGEGDEDQVFHSYGCVLAENTSNTLLMTSSDRLGKAERITVEFSGGEVCEASVREKYDVLNIAVLSVSTGEMSKTTLNMVKAANLGTSAGIEVGDPVIALGNIYGFTDSVGYGMIQDVSGEIQKEDGMYYRIMTDIQGAEDGSGILLNLQGDIIGVVSSAASDADKQGMIAGIGITDLKPVLEFLLNGKTVPYIGIIGTDVTEEAAKEQEMPAGVYVQGVSADSPAMDSGVKNGDIFTKINDEEIVTLDDYHRALMKCKAESEINISGMRRGNDGYVEMDFKIELK